MASNRFVANELKSSTSVAMENLTNEKAREAQCRSFVSHFIVGSIWLVLFSFLDPNRFLVLVKYIAPQPGAMASGNLMCIISVSYTLYSEIKKTIINLVIFQFSNKTIYNIICVLKKLNQEQSCRMGGMYNTAIIQCRLTEAP